MVQLMKSETLIAVGNANDIDYLYGRIDFHLLGRAKKTISTTCGGYVKRNQKYLSLYKGRYGVGLVFHSTNHQSSRYCLKQYIIYDIEYEELEKIVRAIVNITEEGSYRWN